MWIESFQDFYNPQIFRTRFCALFTTCNKHVVIENKLFVLAAKRIIVEEVNEKHNMKSLQLRKEFKSTFGGSFHLMRGTLGGLVEYTVPRWRSFDAFDLLHVCAPALAG